MNATIGPLPIPRQPLTSPERPDAAEAVWCTFRGPRRFNADAVADYRRGPWSRLAVAVAGGDDDTLDGAWASTVAADAAAREVGGTSAVDAVLEAGYVLRRSAAASDASLAVVHAPLSPGAPWSVAWVGDCRAYAGWGPRWRRLRTEPLAPHELDDPPPARQEPGEHPAALRVTTTAPHEIGRALTLGPEWVVLVTGGVHRALGEAGLLAALRGGQDASEKCYRVEEALRDATLDGNATALVVRALRPPAAPRGRPHADAADPDPDLRLGLATG